MKNNFKLLVVLVFLFLSSMATAAFVQTTYRPMCVSQENPTCNGNYPNGVATVYALEGENIALLVTDPTDYNEATLTSLMNIYDNAYAYLRSITGFIPDGGVVHVTATGRTLGVIAVVDHHTCGYACGFLGLHGIETSSANFIQDMYLPYANHQQVNTVIFYEFGRNFWKYGNQLEGTVNGHGMGFTTGFAIFLRQTIAKRAGYTVPPSEQVRLDAIDRMYGLYLADPARNWDNSFGANWSPSVPFVDEFGNNQIWNGGNGNGADFASSLLTHLHQQLGEEFAESFFKHVGKYKYTQPGAIENLIETLFKAASDAANRNLYVDFVNWKIATPPDAQTYIPNPTIPTVWINHVEVTQDEGIFAAWDDTTAPGGIYVLEFGMVNVNTNQTKQYSLSTAGIIGGSGDLYEFINKETFCNDVGTGNFTLSQLRVSEADNPANTAQIAQLNTRTIHCAAVGLGVVEMTPLANGGMQFSIRLNERKQQVHLFARRNGEQDYVIIDLQARVGSEINNGDGTYTYQIIRNGAYAAGNLVEARFYTFTPASGQVFYPGPVENSWTSMTYPGSSSPPIATNGYTANAVMPNGADVVYTTTSNYSNGGVKITFTTTENLNWVWVFTPGWNNMTRTQGNSFEVTIPNVMPGAALNYYFTVSTATRGEANNNNQPHIWVVQ